MHLEPLNKQHRKTIAFHHPQPRQNNVQYPLYGQFGLPINHHAIVRNPTLHMKRIPFEPGFPFPKESRHHWQ